MLKPGDILFNSNTTKFYRIVDTWWHWGNMKLEKDRVWHYRVEPVDREAWYWEKTTETSPLGEKYVYWEIGPIFSIAKTSAKLKGYPGRQAMDIIPPGEFERRGWEIAGKAAKILYGGKA